MSRYDLPLLQEVLYHFYPSRSAEFEAVLDASHTDLAARGGAYPETLGSSAEQEVALHYKPALFGARKIVSETFWKIVQGSCEIGLSNVQQARISKLPKRIELCSETLHVLNRKDGGEPIIIAPTCDSKFCPPCAVVRSAKRAERLKEVCEIFQVSDLYHVVLTVPNCPPYKLGDHCKKLKKALRRCTGQQGGRSRPLPGWDCISGGAWSLEVTRNFEKNTMHPHLHLIVHSCEVEPSALALTRDWKKACNEQGIKARSWQVHVYPIQKDKLDSAIVEASKYISKSLFSKKNEPDAVLLGWMAVELRGAKTCHAWGDLELLPEEKTDEFEQSIPLQKFLETAKPEEKDEVRSLIAKSPAAALMCAIRYGSLTLIPETDGSKKPKRKKQKSADGWKIIED